MNLPQLFIQFKYSVLLSWPLKNKNVTDLKKGRHIISIGERINIALDFGNYLLVLVSATPYLFPILQFSNIEDFYSASRSTVTVILAVVQTVAYVV